MEYPRHEMERIDENDPRWERVTKETSRLEVPGGWIYRVSRGEEGIALQFVPNPNYWGPVGQVGEFIQE